MCLAGDMEQRPWHDVDPLDFVDEVSDHADLQAAKRRRTSNARIGLQSIRKKNKQRNECSRDVEEGGVATQGNASIDVSEQD